MVQHVLDNSRSDSSLSRRLRDTVVVKGLILIWRFGHIFSLFFLLQQVDGFVLTVKHVAADFNTAQVSLLAKLPRCYVYSEAFQGLSGQLAAIRTFRL